MELAQISKFHRVKFSIRFIERRTKMKVTISLYARNNIYPGVKEEYQLLLASIFTYLLTVIFHDAYGERESEQN